MMTPEPDEDALVVAFRERVRVDREAGQVASLEFYQKLFPRAEARLAAVYRELVQPSATGPTVVGAHAAGVADRIGPFAPERRLGKGGQGVVMLARDLRFPGHRVALKILRPHDDQDRARFVHEAETLCRLSHPGICVFHEWGESDGQLYLAMQFVEGETLRKRIQTGRAELVMAPASAAFPVASDSEERTRRVGRGPTGPERPGTRSWRAVSAVVDHARVREIAGVIADCARTLQYVHDAGLIHRDVKPDNIILDAAGRPHVVDFGLARPLDGDAPFRTESGYAPGTIPYMSSEQLTSHSDDLDGRTDVYSLGVTLYELLVLDRPFLGATSGQIREAIVTGRVASPRALNRCVPRDLEHIVYTALDRNRDRRYRTAGAFADDLERFLTHRPVRARAPSTVLEIARWAQRNPVVASLGSAALAFLLVGAVWTTVKNAQLEAALTDFELLADRPRLERLLAEARGLATEPRAIPAMTTWLGNAEALVRQSERHREVLGELRAAVGTEAEAGESAAQASLRVQGDLRRRDLERFQKSRDDVEAWRRSLDPSAFGAHVREAEDFVIAAGREMADARADIAGLRDRFELRRRFRFASARRAVLDAALADYLLDLKRLTDESSGQIARVRRQLAEARRRSDAGVDEARWRELAARLAADERFRDVEVEPWLGLVPLGPDPTSGLEELLHVESHEGPVPVRDGQRTLPVGRATGIILVLLPPGTFCMGAQATLPDAAGWDPWADANEGPTNQRRVEAVLVSKYEMSKAQWRRLVGANPSESRLPLLGGARGRAFGHRGPIEGISWEEATRELARAGLRLPTETEWEYAARAGATGPWPGEIDLRRALAARDDLAKCDDALRSLAQFANLADQSRAAPGAMARGHRWDDGVPGQGSVFDFAANRFGLHQTLGNVWELCADRFTPGGYGSPPNDHRVARGGSCDSSAPDARFAIRYGLKPENRGERIGVRPARSLTNSRKELR